MSEQVRYFKFKKKIIFDLTKIKKKSFFKNKIVRVFYSTVIIVISGAKINIYNNFN